MPTLTSAGRRFQSLDPADLATVLADEDVRESYLDSLSLLDDLLCEFLPEREPPRATNETELVQEIDRLRHALAASPPVARVVDENKNAAVQLRQVFLARASVNEPRFDIELAIRQFLTALLEEYQSIAERY